MLRLNLSVPVSKAPNRLGLLAGDQQGFPNGRRPGDDVVDIELQALEGAAQTGKLVDALAAGDKVDANDHPFGATFPYVAQPWSGSEVKASGSGITPTAARAAGGSQRGGSQATPLTGGAVAAKELLEKQKKILRRASPARPQRHRRQSAT